MQEIFFKDLGSIGYKEAWDYQEELLQGNVQIKATYKAAAGGMMGSEHANTKVQPLTKHYFLLCEHPPVYTLGKSGQARNILISEAERTRKGVDYYQSNRGGDITFHGPGQIVGYPILDLEKYYTDIGKYLRNLEEVVILTLQQYGIKGQRSPGETGVWIHPLDKGMERKICAIGVRCSRWVTMHGFALNVNTNLDYFNDIIPCGIEDKTVTSMEKETGYPLFIEEVKEKLKKSFEEVFAGVLING